MWKKQDNLVKYLLIYKNYIDYQALGRDMEIEGNYLITSHGVFEYSN